MLPNFIRKSSALIAFLIGAWIIAAGLAGDFILGGAAQSILGRSAGILLQAIPVIILINFLLRRELLARKRFVADYRIGEQTRLAQLLDTIPVGILFTDAEYRVAYSNLAMKRGFGAPGGRKCYDYLRQSKVPCLDCSNASVRGDLPMQFQWHSQVNGKSYAGVANQIAGADGTMRRLEVLRDISARREAESERERLRGEINEQHLLLQTVLDHVTSGVAVFDGTELPLKWANTKYRQIVGALWRDSDITGWRFEKIIPNSGKNGLANIFHNVPATGTPHFDPEYASTSFARGPTYWQWSLLPLTPTADRRWDVMLFVTEVTEQVLARKSCMTPFPRLSMELLSEPTLQKRCLIRIHKVSAKPWLMCGRWPMGC